MTTIAWRVAHIGRVYGVHNANHFAGLAWDVAGSEYPGSTADALVWVADRYARWVPGVRVLSEQLLAEPVGPSEGQWGDGGTRRAHQS